MESEIGPITACLLLLSPAKLCSRLEFGCCLSYSLSSLSWSRSQHDEGVPSPADCDEQPARCPGSRNCTADSDKPSPNWHALMPTATGYAKLSLEALGCFQMVQVFSLHLPDPENRQPSDALATEARGSAGTKKIAPWDADGVRVGSLRRSPSNRLAYWKRTTN